MAAIGRLPLQDILDQSRCFYAYVYVLLIIFYCRAFRLHAIFAIAVDCGSLRRRVNKYWTCAFGEARLLPEVQLTNRSWQRHYLRAATPAPAKSRRQLSIFGLCLVMFARCMSSVILGLTRQVCCQCLRVLKTGVTVTACFATASNCARKSSLADALERCTSTGGTVVLPNEKCDGGLSSSLDATGSSLSAAYCYLRMSQDKSGLCLADLPPLIALMRFRETCGYTPVVVVGDRFAACQTDGVPAHSADAGDAGSMCAIIETLFNTHEDLSGRPLPKLRVHRSSEWYRVNAIDFLSQTGRHFRVEDLLPGSQEDVANVPSATLSAFSDTILRAHDWQQVCSMYGPSVQVDSSWSEQQQSRKVRSIQTSLGYLHSRWNQQCIGVLLPMLHHQTPSKTISSRNRAKGVQQSAARSPAAATSTVAAALGPTVLGSRQAAGCYEIYQYLLAVDDQVVERHLRLLTLDSTSDLERVLKISQENIEKRVAQRHLGAQVVSLLFGRQAPTLAKLTTELLFQQRSRTLREASAAELDALRFCLRSHRMKYADDLTLVDLLTHTGCFDDFVPIESRDVDSDVRLRNHCLKVIYHEGFSINGVSVKENRQINKTDILHSEITILGRGRKAYRIIAWE